VTELIATTTMGRVQLDPLRLPAWVVSAALIIHTRSGRPVDVLFLPRRDSLAELAARLEQLRARKGRQLAGWGIGIVAIIHGEDRVDDLVAAFAAKEPWPWWRVYWIDAGGARPIWEAGGHVGGL
jgi:hypothetical protein